MISRLGLDISIRKSLETEVGERAVSEMSNFGPVGFGLILWSLGSKRCLNLFRCDIASQIIVKEFIGQLFTIVYS